MRALRNKRILITGGVGTVGRELVGQICKYHDPKEVRVIDNNESELFFLDQHYGHDNRVFCYLGDIRDSYKLSNVMQGVNIVFHVAALKHVILCEKSPWDAVQTNIKGVYNIINAAKENDVELVLFTSSDKAVNPTNVMGTSKLMGERLITAANATKLNGNGPVFSTTRFGNVLGSNGSVIPIFERQIKKGGPITITDLKMTRFIMTIEDAVSLVLESAKLAQGGEVFVSKMPVIRIEDLAYSMINLLAPKYGFKASEIGIEVIGAKPGEKLYEELMSEEELRRSIELDNQFVVLPAFRSAYHQISYNYANIINKNIENPYNSNEEQPMSRQELEKYLVAKKLINLTLGCDRA
ncbi:polysaccharide biosynthesis protein [Desulfosporosinus sp. OT]|uniref:polysaccharide biosynthesis protein n=1 Tax=Desulfosporosinus sp. OT TaxID=913865 RepID=UPI000223A0ED|nr:polysaccharide biosynthesis protein [Desulfosporosinus sp. OT]EGW41432.1 NAD dependent epimerase/dehydratase family protein [Desulfosporosinus sp. OT]